MNIYITKIILEWTFKISSIFISALTLNKLNQVAAIDISKDLKYTSGLVFKSQIQISYFLRADKFKFNKFQAISQQHGISAINKQDSLVLNKKLCSCEDIIFLINSSPMNANKK